MLSVLDPLGRIKILPANTNFSNPLALANGGTGLVKIGDGDLYVPTVASAVDILVRSALTNRILAKAAADPSPTWFDIANVLGPYYMPQIASRPWTAPRVVHFSASARGTLTSNNPLGGNPMALAGTGTASDGTDAAGAFLRLTTGASSGNIAGVLIDAAGQGTNGQVEFNHELVFICKFRTGSDITNVRIQIGLGNSIPVNSDTPSSRLVGIRYSTVASDAGWVAWTGDNTSTGVTTLATGVSIASSTVYTLIIRVYPSGSLYLADITINGTTVTMTLPGPALFNTGPVGHLGVITQTTAARVIDIARMVLVARHNEQQF